MKIFTKKYNGHVHVRSLSTDGDLEIRTCLTDKIIEFHSNSEGYSLVLDRDDYHQLVKTIIEGLPDDN